MARDIGTVRDAMRTRLANLPNVVAFDVSTGAEDARMANGVVVQIFPAPPEGGQHWPTMKRGDGALMYTFQVYLWVSLTRGVSVAQDILDSYVSPRGTHTNSVQGVLEDAATYAGDALATLADYVRVGGFTAYRFGQLNTEGPPNALTAVLPVTVAMKES